MAAKRETFMIDTELQRDALYAGIWTRLCNELRGHAEGHHLAEYIEQHSTGRGDPTTLFDYLDEDIAFLTAARERLRAVERTPIGDAVELDDVVRFMPVAWKEPGGSGPGRWIYTDSEAEEADLLAPERVRRVRRVRGGDA